MVRDDIISHTEIARRHGMIQRGINYGKGRKQSVILMSGRKDAPYVDKEIGGQIVYEGEDVYGASDKKGIDQELTKGNKDLYQATIEYLEGKRGAEPIQVYEKISSGKWIDRGIFKLVGIRKVFDNKRYVFRFILSAGAEKAETLEKKEDLPSRHISSEVQLAVWKRDNGKCVSCGSEEKLHFDHIIPFSKGGSNAVENIQILCAQCNLKKHDKIGGEK
jgi:hypothetical protein